MVWRCKRMRLEEWIRFQDRFNDLFAALGGPRDMMLLVRRDPDDFDQHIVLVSGSRLDAIEALASGGWSECRDPQEHKWQLLVAHQDTPGEHGLELGSDD